MESMRVPAAIRTPEAPTRNPWFSCSDIAQEEHIRPQLSEHLTSRRRCLYRGTRRRECDRVTAMKAFSCPHDFLGQGIECQGSHTQIGKLPTSASRWLPEREHQPREKSFAVARKMTVVAPASRAAREYPPGLLATMLEMICTFAKRSLAGVASGGPRTGPHDGISDGSRSCLSAVAYSWEPC